MEIKGFLRREEQYILCLWIWRKLSTAYSEYINNIEHEISRLERRATNKRVGFEAKSKSEGW